MYHKGYSEEEHLCIVSESEAGGLHGEESGREKKKLFPMGGKEPDFSQPQIRHPGRSVWAGFYDRAGLIRRLLFCFIKTKDFEGGTFKQNESDKTSPVLHGFP